MLILTIHPRFAHMISLSRGEKSIESLDAAFRPDRPISLIALYASAPEKSLMGLVRAFQVLVDTPRVALAGRPKRMRSQPRGLLEVF